MEKTSAANEMTFLRISIPRMSRRSRENKRQIRPPPYALPPEVRAPAVEHREVDAPIEVSLLEIDRIGFMEEVGLEDDRPVGAIRDRHRFCPGFPKECAHCRRIAVVCADVPLRR